MADFSLQTESARANPGPLSLHSAALALENLAGELAEVSALVWLASSAEALEPMVAKALRAVMARLDDMAQKAERESEAFLNTHGAARAALQ